MRKTLLLTAAFALLAAPAMAQDGIFSTLADTIQKEAINQVRAAAPAALPAGTPQAVRNVAVATADQAAQLAVSAGATPTTAPISEEAALDAGALDLYAIPELPKDSKALPYCGNLFKTDCIKDRDSLKKIYPDERVRRRYAAAGQGAKIELNYWFNFYDPATGKVSFPEEKRDRLESLNKIVQRNNESVAKGLLHPIDLFYRECIKKQILNDNTVPKPDMCKGGV